MTVRQWLARYKTEAGRADARILLCYALGWDRAQVMARLDVELDHEFVNDKLYGLETELAHGFPLPYITGRKEFYGREFRVDENVLIPRPDTETLIEVALQLEFPDGHASVLDIGTGSGCIAITLAAERSIWDVTGSDVSEGALIIAKANAHNLKIRTEFVLSDLFDSAPGSWDLVVGNPPYIGRAEQLPESVRNHEPHLALFAEEDGHAIYRRLADEGRAHTKLMLVEVGYLQAQSVPAIFAEYGWTLEQRKADLNGIERAQLFRQ